MAEEDGPPCPAGGCKVMSVCTFHSPDMAQTEPPVIYGLDVGKVLGQY